MNESKFRHNFIPLLVVLCLITTGIMPFCDFISGKSSSFITICTANGLETLPSSNNNNNVPEQDSHGKADLCSYCFSAQSSKITKAAYKTTEQSLTGLKTLSINIYKVKNSPFSPKTMEDRAPPTLS